MSRHHCTEFYSIIPMGACRPGCTEAQILKLKKILDDCIIEIGGLQQPPHSNSEEEAQRAETEQMQGWNKVRSMVRDIAMALTGESIRFAYEETLAEEQAELDKEFERAVEREDQRLKEDKEYRNPHHGEEDDYIPSFYDDDEYVGIDLEEEDNKITSQDLLNAMDRVVSDPRMQRTLSFCKGILDDVKETLK